MTLALLGPSARAGRSRMQGPKIVKVMQSPSFLCMLPKKKIGSAATISAKWIVFSCESPHVSHWDVARARNQVSVICINKQTFDLAHFKVVSDFLEDISLPLSRVISTKQNVKTLEIDEENDPKSSEFNIVPAMIKKSDP